MNEFLKVSKLFVSIGSVQILRNISLSIQKGEFVGLIGRNGAGKTTLMRSIMGLLQANSGDIYCINESIKKLQNHQIPNLGIGYMPEDRRLVPNLTVKENILLPAWANQIKDSNSKLKKILNYIPEIKIFLNRKGLELSGGQQKLAALARALMIGDKILLLDEPFEGVAPVLANRLLEVISTLKNSGLSILLSESDLTHSKKIIDRIYKIDRGEINT